MILGDGESGFEYVDGIRKIYKVPKSKATMNHSQKAEKECLHTITHKGSEGEFCVLCLATTNTSEAPENYERDHSHFHCWEETNPPCGLKGKHRCCLCEKPVPEASEAFLKHHKTRQAAVDVDCAVAAAKKAPTDESWEKEFDKRFGEYGFFKQGILPDELKSFITSLLQKEHEKGLKDIYHYHYHFNAGKSEAYQTVRKLCCNSCLEKLDSMIRNETM